MESLKSFLGFDRITFKALCLSIGVANAIVAAVVIIIASSNADESANIQTANDPYNNPDSRFISYTRTIILTTLRKFKFTLFVYICSVVSFIFSVFLCLGVQKGKLEFIKMYIHHGIITSIVVTLTSTGFIIGLQKDYGSDGYYTTIIMLIILGCAFYSFLMFVVYCYYKKMKSHTDDTESLLPTEENPPPYENCSGDAQ